MKELILVKVISVKNSICHYWFLIMDSNFKILYVMVTLIWQFYIIFIITVKKVDYCCIIHDINKSEAINLLENYVLETCGYR